MQGNERCINILPEVLGNSSLKGHSSNNAHGRGKAAAFLSEAQPFTVTLYFSKLSYVSVGEDFDTKKEQICQQQHQVNPYK